MSSAMMSVAVSPSVLHFLGCGVVRCLKNLVVVFGGLWIRDCCCQCVLHGPWRSQFEPSDLTTGNAAFFTSAPSLCTYALCSCWNAAPCSGRTSVRLLRCASPVTLDSNSRFCTRNVLWAACSGPRCGQNAGSFNTASDRSRLGLCDVGGMIGNCL